MAKIVFDASVLLSLLQSERIDAALPNLRWVSMSAVNLAEVYSKLASGGPEVRAAAERLVDTLYEVAPFTKEQAVLVGELVTEPQVKGLSLGDRACLALGLSAGAEIYTADRIWGRLRLPLTIHIVR